MTELAFHIARQPARPLAPMLGRGAEWAMAGLLALGWAALIRGPFLHVAAIDGDEALFLMIGRAWAAGQPPYTVIWDLKPPGLYLVYAAVSRVFGDDLAGPKIASLVAVAATSLALYAFAARGMRSRTAGIVALILYTPATTVLDGLASKPDLLMATPIAWAAVAAFASSQAARPRQAAGWALVAGLLLGCAGTMKQTAAFEATYFLLVLARTDHGRGARATAFVAGCAVAPVAFALWFARQGLFAPLVQAAVLSAFQRLGGDGVGLGAAPLRLLAMLKPVIPLVLGTALLWAERRRIEDPVLRRGLGFVAGWALASAVGVLSMRATYAAYFQPLMSPLALLAAGFLVFIPWFGLRGRGRALVATVLIFAAILWPVLYLRTSPDARLLRTRLPRDVGAFIRGQPLRPGETIYVVDYEPVVYLLAGAAPPTRFVLPMHLVCPFRGVGVRPQAEIARIMARNPRCLVVSASRARMACEDTALTRLPEKLSRGRYSLSRRFTDGSESVDVICRPS